MSIIAFDVDDTLIIPACATEFEHDTPNYDVIALYRWFQAQGNHMVIWSGGGAAYAKQWADKLGLVADEYLDKRGQRQDAVDLAFDDSDLTLARVNIKVKRLKNSVIRYPDRV